MTTALERLKLAAQRTAQPATVAKPMSAIEKLKAKLAQQNTAANIALGRVSLTHLTQAMVTASNAQLKLEDSTPSAPAQAPWVWHEKQQEAINLASDGNSFCLIGSAGTGKTATEREIIRQACNRIAADLNVSLEKFIPSEYVIVCAYTRRAVRNTYKSLRELGTKYTDCCMTVHKALQYMPVWTEGVDEYGNPARTMRFEPQVTAENPDPKIQLIAIDEASMLGYQGLYRQLVEAFPNAKFIYIGDLNQLKPVMDDPTLAYKLNDVPVVELTHVYRQALTSPIVAFQYDYTLQGKVPTLQAIADYNKAKAGLSFFQIPWKFQDAEAYARTIVAKYFKPSFHQGLYDPEEAMILVPFNKKFGSIIINREIAQFLGEHRGATVYEIIAGSRKKYFAVGDSVLHDKRECTITAIDINSKYSGLAPKMQSRDLSREGHYVGTADAEESIDILNAVDFVFSTDGSTETLDDEEDDKRMALKACSHIITLVDKDTGTAEQVSTVGDINSMDWSYCMTIHKSQGSEWKKVYLIAHSCHSVALSRELLYTGMTRAAEELVVCWSTGKASLMSESSIGKAILRQDIKGKTWREKAAAFGIKGEGLLWRG